MAVFGTLYSYPHNPRAMKIQAVAAFSDLIVDLDPNFVMFKTNRSAEFLDKFPLGKVPTFIGADNLALFESDTIAQYVAESGPAETQLLGATARERAVISQWVHFADHEFFEPLTTLILWRYGLGTFDRVLEEQALQRLEKSLSILETHLLASQYVGSETVTMADISVAASLYWGFDQIIDREMRARYPAVVEWYQRILGHEKIKPSFGDVKLIEARRASPEKTI
ncbi:Hypothetical protein PENO1_105590 [Penicillium occitanis (nom. inval.)]|nr:Hypothetical protein PENO1_105590 [Penicillium occitanis (nom. inval.)]PCG93532.1 hypothetical protein PENOC_087230 [Penicillium occitanis (nom. inval.)]